MIWRLTALMVACFAVSAEAVTFSRRVSDEQPRNPRQKRDSWAVKSSFTTCKTALSPREQKTLGRNTYETGFHGDDGFTFSLTWVGDGTGVILVLSTVSTPLESFYEGGSTRLYRSEDYGKSFHDISHAINSSFIKKDFGICAGPGNSQQVILTAELPITHTPGGVIFTSVDSGVTFKSVQLPFHPAQPISFHDQNQQCLLVIGTDSGLWLSQDFGNSWSKIHDGVYSFTWGPGNTLFFSYSPENTVEADKRGELFLRRTRDLGQTFTTIAQNVFTFGYIGGFLFTSVMEKQGSPRVIYVSSDQGDYFNKALLPTASSEQFYSLLDGDEDMIFIHVDSPGDNSYFGTIYTSDDRGILYSKSLEHHLFGIERKSDFINVTSLRGVYLTNVLVEDGRISTVISFNKGGEWRPLKKPENVECGRGVERCNLHIHGEHSLHSSIAPMLPLSDPSAVGLIIAHGSVGDSISASKPDVYVSSDGGYNWIGTLRGPHHYSILDSGGLIVAVEAHKDRPVNSIKFSTDEGQCWKTYNFTVQPFFIAGLASEPGTKSMNIGVFGYRPEDDDRPMWVAVTIDFEQLLTRECNEDDYEEWLAHSDDGGASETDGCVLGYKETYRRLRKMSVCRNGRNYVVSKQQTPCPCTREDYMCDYGYYRHENSSECVEEANFSDKKLEICLNGEMEELYTKGYRKIPSDKCQGGFSPLRHMDASNKHCGNSSEGSSSGHHLPRLDQVWLQIVIGVSVGVVVLAVITAVANTVRRMNYRQRSTTYRFSALQLHEDEPCITSISGPSSNRASFQEDSDDDLIE
ncbi:sortilin isoform X1 [Pygocentrus nattereri]|uniref:VPS10 domain-containing protein n=1 Tax=Pygocentrus nattereri TaxID=42514 RepID=A0A3B4DNP5_PYGNA|nr:sortilin isoform X1 [Pygocentrus nattereri]